MNSDQIQSLMTTFEAHSSRTEGGIEFWLARDLQLLLGYGKWDNFLNVISKAKTACEVSEHQVLDHFADVGKMVDLGSGSQREVDDLMLTRYACYLTLSFWDAELAKARAAATPVGSEGQLSATLLTTEGPIWLPEASPAFQLLPRAEAIPCSMAFLGGTAETGNSATAPVHQFTDGPGRLSRALPLFLAEQMFFGLGAPVSTLSPWLLGDHPGFILSGVAWTDEEAAGHALQLKPPADYVVTTHLKTAAEPWSVHLRLVRTQDHRCLHHDTLSFPSGEPHPALARLAENLAAVLADLGGIHRRSPSRYGVPSGPDFISYLVRLEQLLAVRCSAMEEVPARFLSGERDILDGSLHLCLAHPKCVSLRILLLQTCLSMKRIRPDIIREYLGRLDMLQREYPLPAHEMSVAGAFLASLHRPEEQES